MIDNETPKTYLDIEDLVVYQKLCQLHIEVCDLSHDWPSEERYELGSQVRRSSNSSPAQLAEKNDDRLFMAKLKGYITAEQYQSYRERYRECIRMLNGLERSLDRHLPEKDRHWIIRESADDGNQLQESMPPGWPATSETEH